MCVRLNTCVRMTRDFILVAQIYVVGHVTYLSTHHCVQSNTNESFVVLCSVNKRNRNLSQ
jgi:hypothetical protein